MLFGLSWVLNVFDLRRGVLYSKFGCGKGDSARRTGVEGFVGDDSLDIASKLTAFLLGGSLDLEGDGVSRGKSCIDICIF